MACPYAAQCDLSEARLDYMSLFKRGGILNGQSTEGGTSCQIMNIMIFNFSPKENSCDDFVTSCFDHTGREVSSLVVQLV